MFAVRTQILHLPMFVWFHCAFMKRWRGYALPRVQSVPCIFPQHYSSWTPPKVHAFTSTILPIHAFPSTHPPTHPFIYPSIYHFIILHLSILPCIHQRNVDPYMDFVGQSLCLCIYPLSRGFLLHGACVHVQIQLIHLPLHTQDSNHCDLSLHIWISIYSHTGRRKTDMYTYVYLCIYVCIHACLQI